MPGSKPNLFASGWARNMPAPASRALMGIFLLGQAKEPPLGELDDDGTAAWVSMVAPRGLDEPYDPAEEEGWTDDVGAEKVLWEEWQGYAADRSRRLRSCRDIIEFMVELDVIEKLDDGIWRIVTPLSNVEDVLPLSPERREREAQIRWRLSFRKATTEITSWLAEQWVSGEEQSEIAISIEAMAAETGLDPEDTRHGLALLLDDDIRCDADPETAGSDQLLRITVNWSHFEEGQTVYRASPPEGDEGVDRRLLTLSESKVSLAPWKPTQPWWPMRRSPRSTTTSPT